VIIKNLSVSQINSFNPAEDGGCNLRWYYVKVMGRKEPQKSFNELGTLIHAQLKHYLTTGEDVLGKMAAAGRKFLPPAVDPLAPDDTHLKVEWGLNNKPQPIDAQGKPLNYFPAHESFVRAAGIPLIGFIDVVEPRALHVLPDGSTVDEPGTIEVIDHKSSSNVEKWSKPGEKLIETTQMPGYGVFALKRYPWAKKIRLSHINYSTDEKRAPFAKKESAIFSVETISERWEKVVEPIAEKMKVVSLLKEEEVEGNLGSCEAYGGCPHKSYCHTRKQQSPLKRVQMGLLKNKVASNAAPAPAAVVATNGASNTPWIQPPPQIGAAPAAPVAPEKKRLVMTEVPSAGATLPVQNAVGGQTYITAAGAKVNLSGEAGPGWRVFTPAEGGPPAVIASTEMLTLFVPPPPPAPVVVREPDAPPAPAPLSAQVQVAPTKKRGRPSKEEVAARAASAGTAPAAATQEAEYALFINAIPNGEFIDLGIYTNELVAEMREEYKVSDIRCAPADSAIAYRKFEGVLASLVRDEPPTPGTYVAFTRGNPFVEIVAEALGALCAPGQLVRGI